MLQDLGHEMIQVEVPISVTEKKHTISLFSDALYSLWFHCDSEEIMPSIRLSDHDLFLCKLKEVWKLNEGIADYSNNILETNFLRTNGLL